MIQNNASVVVLIVNWNGIEDTIECVNSICDSNFKDFELYIIDNNSQESDSKTLKKQFGSNDKICLRFYDKNYGFTKAHIKIFKEELITKKFEWLLLLNNDVTIDINCISNLISHANTNHLDITSSKMINYFKRSEMDNAGHRVISTGEIIPIGSGQNVDEFD